MFLQKYIYFMFQRRPILGLVLITFGVLCGAFYRSEGRHRTEEYFYDLRTRLKSNVREIKNVVLLEISEESIRNLNPGIPVGGNLSLEQLLRAVRLLETTNIAHLLILNFEHIFSYEDPAQGELVELVASNEHFSMGTLGLNSRSRSLLGLPEVFQPVRDKVFGIDSLKKRSNSVVRSLPYRSFRGLVERDMAPIAVVNSVRRREYQGREYFLNYVKRQTFPSVEFSRIFSDTDKVKLELAGKVVVLGYTAFRQIAYQTNDQINWNTPLEGDHDNYQGGAPATYVTALAIENLLNDTVLVPAPFYANVLQVVLITLISLFAWRAGVGVAPVIIIFSWLGLFWVHIVLFETASVLLPMADAFLFSSGAVVVGLLFRLQQDIKTLAVAKSRAEAKQEVANVQASFLDRFASELAKMNKTVDELLRRISADKKWASKMPLVERAVLSSEEFGEYLEGVAQFADFESNALENPTLSAFNIETVVHKVLKRFEAKLAEKKIKIKVLGDSNLNAFSNSRIVDTILFNFISNAIKYSPNETEVVVGWKRDGKYIILSVKDQGPGIDGAFKERIFEKFYRIKNDDVYRVKGTGLGLYLCQFFAAKISGEISLESTPGHGAEFSLRLLRGKV